MADEVNLNVEDNSEEKTDDLQDVEVTEGKNETEEKSFMGKKKQNAEINKLKAQLEEKEAQFEEMKNKTLRLAAEFDNYKKRSAREMENIYTDVKCDTVKNILPVIDNFERALTASVCDNCTSYKEGVQLIYKQLIDILTSLGVEEINALGEQFNPDLHNAVMHVEDENAKASEIVEVFQKGYKIDNKVIRYSMVKVAN